MRHGSLCFRKYFSWILCVTQAVIVILRIVPVSGQRLRQNQPLPSEFEGLVDCPIGVPDSVLNQCIQLAVEELWPFLAKGVPEINLPGVDPLFYQRLPPCPGTGCDDHGSTPLFAFYNLTILGLSNFTKIRVSLDTRVKSMRLEYTHPLLNISGGYALAHIRRRPWLQGKLLVRIINFSYDSTLLTRLEHPEDPARTRIRVVDVDFKAQFDDLELQLPGFSDSSRLGAWFTKNVLERVLKFGLRRYFNTAFPKDQVTLWEDPKLSPVPALSYFFLPYFTQPSPTS